MAALLEAAAKPDYGVRIAAVGADRESAQGLDHARQAGAATFTVPFGEYPDRQQWDAELARQVEEFAPDFVVAAGFMRILGPEFLARHTVVNSHPALLPAFPGAHAVRDALSYGVCVTGATVHFVDEGVDTGPVIEQAAVRVRPDDDVTSLHGRIKTVERDMLVDVVGRLAAHGWAVEQRQVRLGPDDAGSAHVSGDMTEENR